jgi:hypothetical protein
VATTGELIRGWTGNFVSWFEIPPPSLEQMAGKNEPIVKDWIRDAIRLAGVPLSQLLRRQRESEKAQDTSR